MLSDKYHTTHTKNYLKFSRQITVHCTAKEDSPQFLLQIFRNWLFVCFKSKITC